MPEPARSPLPQSLDDSVLPELIQEAEQALALARAAKVTTPDVNRLEEFVLNWRRMELALKRRRAEKAVADVLAKIKGKPIDWGDR